MPSRSGRQDRVPARQLSHVYGSPVGTNHTDRPTGGAALGCSPTARGRYLHGNGISPCHQHPLAGEAPFQNEMNGEISGKLVKFAATD